LEAAIKRSTLAFALSFFMSSCSQEADDKLVISNKTKPHKGFSSTVSDGGSYYDSKDLEALPDSELPVTSAGFRIEGERIYELLCASCHQSIAVSNRKGVDAGKIINDYTKNFPTHRGTPWPTDEEAYMIEAALSFPQP
jgi:hypothetical protein